MPDTEEHVSTIEGSNKPFGWLEFFTGEKRPCKAVSQVASNVYSIQKTALMELLDRYPVNRVNFLANTRNSTDCC